MTPDPMDEDGRYGDLRYDPVVNAASGTVDIGESIYSEAELAVVLDEESTT